MQKQGLERTLEQRSVQDGDGTAVRGWASGEDGWSLRQTELDPDRRARDETLFALANGALGVRGGFEEMRSPSDACFLAAVYERTPIEYHERFPGFASENDARVPVADGKRIVILLDGAPLDPLACEWIDFERILDLRRGRLRRRLRLRTPQGATLQIDSERFVRFDEDMLAIRFRVTSIDFDGLLSLESAIEVGQGPAARGSDPRIGTSAGGGMDTFARSADQRGALLVQRTRRSSIVSACGQSHRLLGDRLAYVGARTADDAVVQRYDATLGAGDSVGLEKFVAYAAYAERTAHDTWADAPVSRLERGLEAAVAAGFDALFAIHAGWLSDFWREAAPAVGGSAETQLALRFNLFHLLQSASRTPRNGTAAKGLTGEGYEGHCFWDTEVFVLPVMVFTAPEIARAMLMYRYRALDAAREHAHELDHARGALYPWRTIAGGECSAHYPSGSAAYHINAAVAYAIGLYLDASGDEEFVLEAGAEMLFETARIWPQVGHCDPLRGGAFGIYGVTGPDEYSVLVDNNFYTNRMAQRHLLRAVAVWRWMAESHPRALRALAERLALEDDEVAGWERAAVTMRLPVDADLEIYAQDDAFLHKPRWDPTAARSGRPLLLDHHPLTLYRHQVCKQADAVMALVLAGDGLDAGRKRRSFDYYEAVTTHDSTLSASIHGILAGELGLHDKALRYFEESLRVDLDDLHGNTDHGVHMAAMAGSWLGVAWGFAGMRVIDGGLAFAPSLPAGWTDYAFGLRWRGRSLRVEVGADGVRYRLLAGEPLCIAHAGWPLWIESGEPRLVDRVNGARPADGGSVGFPRACRALIFDLDGVLTDTASIHFQAWKRLTDEIGVAFDEQVNRWLKGVDRDTSLEIILERAERDYDAEEKRGLAERKDEYYRAAVAALGPQDLFAGARELLSTARRAGLRLALASASRNAPAVLARLGIADDFDVVVDAGAIERPKPHPEIFLTAARLLGVAPSDCIGIEDAMAGVAAIKAAGMSALGIGDGAELQQADAVFPTIAEIRLEAIVSLPPP